MTAIQQAGELPAFFNPMSTLLEQGDRWLGTVLGAQQQLLQLQSDLLAETLSGSLPVLMPPLNSDGFVGVPWRLGMLYPVFSERLAKSTRRWHDILVHAQEACIDQSCDAFMALGQRASVTQSQVNALVVDRRVSAQVIDFENRRKSTPAASPSEETQPKQAEASQQTAGRRQAGGRRAS